METAGNDTRAGGRQVTAVSSVHRDGEPLLCTGDDFAGTDLVLVSLDPDEPSADPEPSGESTR